MQPTDVVIRDFETTTADGARLLLRWYSKEGASPGSAVLFLHGSGMILSSVALYDGTVARYVSSSGVPFLSVEYRLAPEFPHPTPVEDAFAGLTWLAEHAKELGVDPIRIAVMGDSGGGGSTACAPCGAACLRSCRFRHRSGSPHGRGPDSSAEVTLTTRESMTPHGG